MKNMLTLAVLLLIVALLATACGGSKEEMITFNQKISGELGAGDTKTYSFEGEEGMYIFLEQLESAEWTTFKITTPDELEQISERGLGDGANRVTAGAIQLRETGVYILDIDQSDDLPTDYAFVIWHVDPPEIVGGTIEFNTLNSGQAAIPGQKIIYTFEGKVGQQIFLEQRNSEMWTSFTVIGPDGLEVFTERGLGDGGNKVTYQQDLRHDGTYTLIVDWRDADKGTFDFILWDIDPVVIDGGTLEFDVLIKAETTIPGQIVEYTFEGKVGQQFSFEQMDSDEWIDIILVGPNGLEVFSERGLGDGGNRVVTEVTLMQGGIYTLTIDHRDANRGSVEFIVTTDAAVDEDVYEEEAEDETDDEVEEDLDDEDVEDETDEEDDEDEEDEENGNANG